MSAPRRSPRLARIAVAGLLLLLVAVLVACRRGPSADDLPGASSEPAGAVRQLAGHVQRNDLQAFARDALPAEEYTLLAHAWSDGRSRWPLTELPLDERIGPMLAALSAPDAEQKLRRSFDAQFAGQDKALGDAARTVALFGSQYVKTQGEYSDEERAHYAQVLAALAGWAGTAPLGERKRGHAAIDQLAEAARATGLNGDDALAAAGMEDSLRRLGPFAATLKSVLAGYGLDLDHSLSHLRIGLVEERGDHATVRIHYPLAGTEIDTTVSLTRRGGRWYLSDYLEHAATMLREAPAAEPGIDPTPPGPADPAEPHPAEPTAGR
ncbi:MAG: hypothetical protein J0L89_10745 [Xanthomonadales bacterium]|nr:hypothetical protein [Xanthomonadales bacterium]